MLVISQDLDELMEISDRFAALNEGRLVFEGTPQEIDDDKFKEIYGKEAERVG